MSQVLIETLLRSRSGTVEGLSLARDLCKDFGVNQPEIWSQILAKLAALHQWDHLQAALEALDATPQLWSLPAYLEAWTLLVERPFKNATKPVTMDQKQDCLKAFQLLLKCPVPQNLTVLSKIKTACEELGMDELFCDEFAIMI